MNPVPSLPPCHLCGKEAAIEIDGEGWCEGCLHARASCCAESEMEEEDLRCAEKRVDLEG